MSDPINLNLGPCQILYDNVDLGYTDGDVKFKDEVKSKDVMVSQLGETPYDGAFLGRVVELNAPFAQTSLANLAKIIPGASLNGDTLTVSNVVGSAMYANAKEVIVKPIKDGIVSTDTKEWLHIFKAFAIGKPEWAFGAGSDKTTPVLFKAFPDRTSGTAGRIYRLGPAVA